jgi:ATP-binding cassette subfamily C (CFTR/MRP) protein 4
LKVSTIFIDGIDTKAVLLHTLRSRIAIIPQEPIFFLGTLLQNLDPFKHYENSHLWNALEEVELKDFVSSLPSGLESEILEGGSNFSVGQRQLFCLVRAILKNAKIVAFTKPQLAWIWKLMKRFRGSLEENLRIPQC